MKSALLSEALARAHSKKERGPAQPEAWYRELHGNEDLRDCVVVQWERYDQPTTLQCEDGTRVSLRLPRTAFYAMQKELSARDVDVVEPLAWRMRVGKPSHRNHYRWDFQFRYVGAEHVEAVDVVFRVPRSKKAPVVVTAVFPHVKTGERLIACYSTVGQHQQCCRAWVMQNTSVATPEQYAELKAELESPPNNYVLRVHARATGLFNGKRTV